MNTKGQRIPALLATIAAGLALAACGGNGDDGNNGSFANQVSTSYGKVAGSLEASTGTVSWKGVPYAQPPVGALRWKAPVAPAPWAGVMDTKDFGRSCSSVGGLYGPGYNDTWDATIGATIGNNTPVGAEDCLTVNIWRPNTGATNLPVVIFVHGGGNTTGYSADPMFQLGHLAHDSNLVTVSVNYRLGVLGFFNMAQLKTGNASDDSGNFAVLDLIQMLKFVKANIAAFGGDPNNVTFTGQSAGSGLVWSVVVSPQGAGLFQKVVPMSGGIFAPRPTTDFGTANSLYYNLLINAGLATDIASAQTYAATQTPAQIATFMRGVSGPTLMAVAGSKGLNVGGVFGDGAVYPVDPMAAVAAGRYNKASVMSGNTAEEGKLFTPLNVTQSQLFPILFNYDADSTPPPTVTIADIIRPAMLPVTTPVTGYNAVAASSPVVQGVAAATALNALSSQQSNLWGYRFDWNEEPAPWNDVYGAAHVFDVAFWFSNFERSVYGSVIVSKANEPGRLALSKAMMSSLAAFAKTGNPNAAELGVTWPMWPARLIFDATKTQKAITVE